MSQSFRAETVFAGSTPTADPRRHLETSGLALKVAKWAVVAAGVLGGVILAGIIWLAGFVRFTGDDFSTTAAVKTIGFFRAQVWWFEAWSGRYTATLVTMAAQQLGPRAIWIVDLLLIAVSVAALRDILKRVLRPAERPWWVLPWACASTMIAATLYTTPAMGELVFWITGSLTYTAALFGGLILLAVWLACEQSGRHPGLGWTTASFFAGVVLAGMSETSSAFYAAGTGMLFLRAVAKKQRCARLLAWAMLGLLLGTAIMGAAPGTIVRLQTLLSQGTPRHDVTLANTVLLTSFYLPYRLLRHYPAVTLAVTLLGIVVGMLGEDDGCRGVKGKRLLRLLLIAGSVVVLMAAACVPAAMVSPGSRPPDRALLFPNTALVFAVTYFGLLVGRALRSKVRGRMVTAAWITSALLLMTSTLAAFGVAAVTMWQVRSAAREFAATWDREDRYIGQQARSGNADLVVSPIYTDFAIVFPTYGFSQMSFAAGDELSVYPTHWVNQSVAAYYGIRSIRSSNDLGDPSRRLNEPLTLPTPASAPER